ncbi:MAG: HD domain-containing protein [Candidatus Methylomirabilia bacterium]
MNHATRTATIAAVRAQYRLDWDGIHGRAHWERVLENGLRLAGLTGARTDVVELFAYFHDACRHNDSRDPEHGARGAELARSLAGTVFDLDPQGLALLVEACTGHTRGETVAEATVATCWDADRLDLARVGKTPRPELLCTDAARDPAIIAWACGRSLR